MARPKKNAAAKVADPTPEVVGSTVEDKQEKDLKQGADVATICVSLRNGHIFDDIPDGNGGVKKIHLAGLDDHLRGKKAGILTDKGNAIYQTLPRSDWEALIAIHGKERMFNSYNGFPPCVFEVKNITEAKRSATIQDQIKSSQTGLDPVPENSPIQ